MRNHLPSGKIHLVDGWQPRDDQAVIALIWETKSITPEIESSLFTAEIIRDTTLVEVMTSSTLDDLQRRLREKFGERLNPDDDPFEAAARLLDEMLADTANKDELQALEYA